MLPINDTLKTDGWPWMTTALVVANLVVYGLAVSHGGLLFAGPSHAEETRHGLIAAQLTHPHGRGAHPWLAVITAMFLHGSIVALLVDVGFLAIFGSTVEDATGPLRLLALYVAGGVASAALLVAVQPHCSAPFIGAQGAVGATIGAYLVLYPRARVLVFSVIPLFFTVFEAPVGWIVAVWFAVQAAFGATHLIAPVPAHPGGWLSYVDSIGGCVLGAAVIRAMRPRVRELPPARALRDPRP